MPGLRRERVSVGSRTISYLDRRAACFGGPAAPTQDGALPPRLSAAGVDVGANPRLARRRVAWHRPRLPRFRPDAGGIQRGDDVRLRGRCRRPARFARSHRSCRDRMLDGRVCRSSRLIRSAPNYVSAPGLVSTRPGADSEEGRQNRLKMIEQVERDGVDGLAGQMTPKLLGAATQKSRRDLTEHVRCLIVANTATGIEAAIRAMMARSNSTPLLPGIKIPTLIVHGAEDTLIPIAEAEAMHRAIPRSEYEPMSLSGHLPNLEQASAFEGKLWRFLEEVMTTVKGMLVAGALTLASLTLSAQDYQAIARARAASRSVRHASRHARARRPGLLPRSPGRPGASGPVHRLA